MENNERYMTKSKVCELLQDFVHYIDHRDYNLLNRELIDFANEIQSMFERKIEELENNILSVE
jgi:hypothetical protein